MGEASAKIRAEEIQATLDPSIPSLIIIMLKSQIGGGFWLGIPTDFCKAFMSEHKIVMKLVDEKNRNHEVTYIPRRGLSGGWKKFAVDHKLRFGDALLFQLVDLMKFKVFIVKGNRVADTNGGADNDDGLTLMQMKAQAHRRTRGIVKLERKPVAKRVRSANVVTKKSEKEEDEPKKHIKKRKKTEKLLTKKRFDLAGVTDFRRIIKNLCRCSKRH